ncbi:hypothetical protein [Vibrio sp. SCSIO 43136]|uniref:hypothetical protein n=1 Tax=Vibrio sp. SCSIO 43136 TaxID=2819101 RepID=UPI0020757706|nr:hypothetical protein [Vibrio sp. SCSIO 43136]USD64149.1 hypothetical protein J4N39_08465 [Vibrio sp. SCSIO 43136]
MRKTLLAVSLIAASTTAMANDDQAVMSNFNYDYAEARIGGSPLTFGGGMSKSIHPNAHVIASLDSEFKGDFDFAGGVGFHAPINNWADVTGEMLFRAVDADNFNTNGTKTGMHIRLGVRQWLGPQLEVGGTGGYISMNDFKEEFTGSVYARFHSTELFSLGIEGHLNDVYGDHFVMSARFKF